MKQLYLVANWKSNKSLQEAKDWMEQIVIPHIPESLHILLFAPFTLLSLLKDEIQTRHLPIALGAQTISSFPSGAYTGEISAQMVQGLVEYVLIGHSERRRYFHESNDVLMQKVREAKNQGLKSIYGVEGFDQSIPDGTAMILYEPPTAIGTGKTGNPEDVNAIGQKMSERYPNLPFLYGGSVTETSVKAFITEPTISGVGVGGASLNPVQFSRLIESMASL